jgi:hypothetical protein
MAYNEKLLMYSTYRATDKYFRKVADVKRFSSFRGTFLDYSYDPS